jgi:hypothetical protein
VSDLLRGTLKERAARSAEAGAAVLEAHTDIVRRRVDVDSEIPVAEGLFDRAGGRWVPVSWVRTIVLKWHPSVTQRGVRRRNELWAQRMDIVRRRDERIFLIGVKIAEQKLRAR